MVTRIRINGVDVSVSGSGNLSIRNGRVIINGKDVTPDVPQIRIEVQGDVSSIQADACEQIHVTGSVGEVKTSSGDVRCGDVAGSVQVMSGDVTCGNVAGSVSTMSGDIRHR